MKIIFASIFLLVFLIPSVSASVVVSEVLYDPDGSDTGKEFVELYNPMGEDVNISGWILETGDGGTADDWTTEATFSVVLPAHHFYLIGETNVTGADVVTTLDLQNGPDGVRIKDSFGTVIDTVGYGNKDKFNTSEYYEMDPFTDVQEGHSIERKPGYEDPLAGNGEDTNNNSADFLDRAIPEPQNSSAHEFTELGANIQRLLIPCLDIYPPNMSVKVVLEYSFFTEHIGLIVKDFSPGVFQDSLPGTDYRNESTGLSKWLLKSKEPLVNGTIEYTFLTPTEDGTYLLDGEWEAIDGTGNIISGDIPDFEMIIAILIQGFVEDIFGHSLANATVSLDDSETLTDEQGHYSIARPDDKEHNLTASKALYLPEHTVISATNFFNFTGEYSLIPEQLTNEEMLQAVFRWVNNYFSDDKLLKVIHQWAQTPE